MRTGKPYWTLFGPMVLVLAVVAGGVFGPGCSSEEEAAPTDAAAETSAVVEEAPAVDVAQAPAEEAAPAARQTAAAAPAMSGEAPATLMVLQYMPESANAALALPAPTGMVDRMVPVAKKLFPPEDVDNEVNEFINDIAEELNAEGAENLGEVAAAKGLDFSKPVGVFFDLERTMQSVSAGTGDAAADDTAAEDTATDEDADGGADDAMAEDLDADTAEVEMGAEIDAEIPKITLVLAVSDEAKATSALEELVAEDPELAGVEPEQTQAEGVTITVYDPEKFAYFFADNQLFLGNDLDMLTGAAARLGNPATFKYGTQEAPAFDANEAVMLVYGSAIGTQLAEAMAAMGGTDPGMAALIEGQLNKMEEAWAGEGGSEDPLIINLSVNEERLIMASRVDLDTHPKMLEISGEPAALELGPAMPENTQLLFNLRMTQEFKDQLKATLGELPSEVREDPRFATGVNMGATILDMLGDELALGMAPVDGDFPALLVMLGLADAEQTMGLIGMFANPISFETYNEVEIFSVAGAPVPIYLAYPQDTAFASNNLEVMKATIDRLQSGDASGLFGTFQPPLSPDAPRYSTFYLDTNLVTDVVLPLATLVGGIPGDAQPWVQGLSTTVQSLQTTQGVEDNWMVSKMTVTFKEGQMESAPAELTEDGAADADAMEEPADAQAESEQTSPASE